MPATETLLQTYGEVADNPILLEKAVTEPIVEGLGVAYASFMALYLQYQKHHFVVEGSEYYMLHEYFFGELRRSAGPCPRRRRTTSWVGGCSNPDVWQVR